jgi:hypothetical protein
MRIFAEQGFGLVLMVGGLDGCFACLGRKEN